VIEMSTVQPPYLLDFGHATLDVPPDFPVDWKILVQQRIEENFENEEQAEIASMVVGQLVRKYRIYYLDPKPANICFKDS